MISTSIAVTLEQRAAAHPARLLLETPDERFTYADVEAMARTIRGVLVDRGVMAGDHVVLLAGNRDDYLPAVLAVLGLGAVLVPTNPKLRSRELEYILRQSRSRAVLFEGATSEALEAVRSACPDLEISVDLDEIADRRADGPAAVAVESRDLAALLYTSGTTADPKGVMVPHAGFCLAPFVRAKHLGWDADERVLVVNPLFHANGLIQSCCAAIAAGATILLRRTFSASGFWDDIRRSGATTMCGMQTIPRILAARDVDARDTEHSLRTLVGVLPPGLFERFEERFGVILVPAYSLTEDMMSVLNYPDTTRRRKEAAGIPTGDDHDIVILDEAGNPVDPGERGQIVKRSPAMMLGYYDKPAETADVLRDGWVHTGDAGYLDDDGFLYFVDRIKDVIRRSGEMVSSAELESVIGGDLRVKEVAVVPIPDDIRGEEIKAVVVPDQGAALEQLAEALWQRCDEMLAEFKVPRCIEFREDLPRTANLKIRKRTLRDEGELGIVFWRDSSSAPIVARSERA